jgi:putative membrane protein
MGYGMGGYGMGGGMGGYGMGYGGFMGGGILSMIFMVLFWVLVAAAAFFFVRWLIETVTISGKSKETAGQNNALEIAKQRFARGDITREEFLEIKQELG